MSTFSRKATVAISELGSKYPEALHFARVDLQDTAALQGFVVAAVGRFSTPYAVINNAAFVQEGILATLPEIEIDRMISVNLTGAIKLTRLCLRFMLKERMRGRIVNVSSIIGTRGYKGLTVYSATKAGLDGFTRSLAREIGSVGITVNSVAPGYMETDMSVSLIPAQLAQIVNRTPLGKLAETKDVVGMIEYLLSPKGGFITGETILIDGGISS